MDEQVHCNVTGRIDIEEMVFHQESQLEYWLAEIKADMLEHGPRVFDHNMGIGQNLKIDRIPERGK